MIFDPRDPFPLLPVTGENYAEAKHHAAEVDAWLGFRIDETEASLGAPPPGAQTWQGLPPQAWQTPYVEIREMLHRVNPAPGATVVDLGCAYGRMAHVIHRHHPGTAFIGFELAAARVREGRRVLAPLNDPRLRLHEQDLADPSFAPPVADVFFIYDFGAADAVEKILQDLRAQARARAVILIARGRLTRNLVHSRHPWLAEVVAPEHTPHFSIYRSALPS